MIGNPTLISLVCTDQTCDRQVRQVGPNLIYPHVLKMALAVQQDKVADVVNIGLLGVQAEIFKANRSPDLIQQAGWRWMLLTVHRDDKVEAISLFSREHGYKFKTENENI